MKVDVYTKLDSNLIVKSGEQPTEQFKGYKFLKSLELVNGESIIGISKENMSDVLIKIEKHGYFLADAGVKIIENII